MKSNAFIFICICCQLIRLNNAAKTVDVMKCGACKLLVEEMERAIGLVDPKKTIQVGSFRVDPKGNQPLSQKAYARSEVHLHDLMEKVCEVSKKYGLVVHPDTKNSLILRTEDADGTEKPYASKAEMSDLVRSKLRFECESLIEEHEEDMMEYLSDSHSQPVKEYCKDRLHVCQAADLVEYPASKHSDDDL